MVQKWKKLVDKVVQTGSRSGLADFIEDISLGNITGKDISSLSGYRNRFRARLGDYRIVFEKTSSGNKILQVNKCGDIY